MAAHYESIGRVSLGGSSRLEQILLPNGSCSFRDLSAGGKAPTCGCRRFWLNNSLPANQQERAWCFCGHHACFHDFARAYGPVSNAIHAAHTAEHQALAAESAPPFVTPTWSELLREPVEAGANAAISRPTTGLGIRNPSQASHSESINTRLWDALNGFAWQQDGNHSGNTSDMPSTAVPSVVGVDAPASVPTQPLRQAIANNRPMAPPVFIPTGQDILQQNDQYSATEVATPSARGTPDFREVNEQQQPRIDLTTPPDQIRKRFSPRNVAYNALARQNPAPASEASQPRPPLPRSASSGPSLSIQEMCNTIQDYGRRINILESMSMISNIPTEDLHNQFEMVDGRLLDLEQWRVEQDKTQEADDTDERLRTVYSRVDGLESWQADQEMMNARRGLSSSPEASTSRHKRLLPNHGSFESDGSFDMNAAAQTETIVLAALAANAETGPRIDALESRISELESAGPSLAHPWHVQVVLLPFGRQLPGVWFTSSESTESHMRSGTQASDEWNGVHEGPNLSFKSAATSGAWTTESIEAWAHQTENQWLSPKACSNSGVVFQRLASRGLVHDIEVTATDAGHIFSAISEALGNVLESEHVTPSSLKDKYHGLQERFIPLRKVRKSSRLRFLSPAEMVTPAAWSAAFLESSVLMKASGERRLYLTTPEGYLQPPSVCWDWPSLRVLPMYDIGGELQNAQAEGHVIEACWSYNDRLDHIASLHSSFASRSESPWSATAGHQKSDIENRNDVSMASPDASRHLTQRSVSLPSAASVLAMETDSVPKRRVASFEHFELGSSPVEHDVVTQYAAKRRRISSSPEIERRGFNFTPRYSREPPSPFMSDDIIAGRSSQAGGSNRARATTPFAYATPHSHFDSRGGDGDTEPDEELQMAQSEAGDYAEEWEGVPDGPMVSPRISASQRNRVVTEDAMDGADLAESEVDYDI